MISFSKRKGRGPTFVLGVLGDYGRVESALARSIERLEKIARRNDCRIVAALEDRRWETVPLIQALGMRFPRNRLTVFCGDCPDQPATLFSAAAARAQGEILHFLWPGCLPRWEAVATACCDLESEALDWLGVASRLAGQPDRSLPAAAEGFESHLRCGERPLPLCQAVVRRASFLALGGFRTTPELQREFEADYWRRSLDSGQKTAIRAGRLAESRWTWEDFPLQKDLRLPRHRPEMRQTGSPPHTAMPTLALCSHSPRMAGAERMLLNLAILLERSKAVHPVLLAAAEGELTAQARRHGLQHEIVPAPPWYVHPPMSMSHYRRSVRACCEAMKKMLVDLHSDAVLVNTMTSVPAMLAAVELDLPSLLWVHGVLDSQLLPERSSEFATPHDELLLHSATRVIALPNFTSDFCTRVMQRTGLDVIPNWTPVDPQFTAPPEKYRSRRFACLNTFDPHKGHTTLLEAAALLKARNAPFELHLYGDGPIRTKMKRRATALGLQDCVCFQGRTTDVSEVYDRSLCVVNPADVEPFPMTLIEPMARKTPVVATQSGGPCEIVADGRSGYLVDRGDAAAMADCMQALLDSPELAQRLGEEGFRRACSHFNEETAQAAFLPVIEGAIRDFRGYDPAVKTLTKIYRLWLEQASIMHKAARLAKGGLRRLFRA